MISVGVFSQLDYEPYPTADVCIRGFKVPLLFGKMAIKNFNARLQGAAQCKASSDFSLADLPQTV